MNQENYQCSISVKATAEDSFQAINNVPEWWAKKVVGSSDHLNDVFMIDWGETWVKFKITDFDANKKITWHCTDCYLGWLKDKTEWKGTTVVFELASEPGGTKIDFTHKGLVPQVECYDQCVKGWDQYVKGSLVGLLNEGKGQPS